MDPAFEPINPFIQLPQFEPDRLQSEAIVPAQEMTGFDLAKVFFTLEKKNQRKIDPNIKNEDNVLVDPQTGLFGVMDGLGGVGRGDLASKAAERYLPEAFSNELGKIQKMSNGEVGRMLNAIQMEKIGGLATPERRRQAEVMIKNVLKKDPELARKTLALLLAIKYMHEVVLASGGMTTLCTGLIHETPDGARYAIIGNVGDSGAFVRRKNGTVERLSMEDSVEDSLERFGVKTTGGQSVKEFINDHRNKLTGRVDPKLEITIPLTPESVEALQHGASYEELMADGSDVLKFVYEDLKVTVTAALGREDRPPLPSLEIIQLHAGDELMLATDGLVDKYESMKNGELDLMELANDLEIGTTPTERLNNLRSMTKQRKTFKQDDDVAIVLAQIK